jgi:hypothetical protein
LRDHLDTLGGMAQTTDVELLQRCHDFELELSLAAAERVEDLGDGTAAVLLYERLGFDAVGVALGFRIKSEPAS